MDLSEYEPSETKSKTTGVGSTVNMAEENKIASSTFTSDNGKLDISSKSIQLPLSVTTTTTGSVRKAEKYAETAMNMSIWIQHGTGGRHVVVSLTSLRANMYLNPHRN